MVKYECENIVTDNTCILAWIKHVKNILNNVENVECGNVMNIKH